MYAFILKKRKTKVHEVDPQGRTYCQAQNSSTRLTFSDKTLTGRCACKNCEAVKQERFLAELNRQLNEQVQGICH
jgi:hypothetical protein